jgi:hypothetical protein
VKGAARELIVAQHVAQRRGGVRAHARFGRGQHHAGHRADEDGQHQPGRPKGDWA